MPRPYTTLFLLVSVDGKISTGSTDLMDVDRDYPAIPGLKEGLKQYYDIEKQTDLFSLNTGKVLAKIGFNEKSGEPDKSPVNFIVIDNKPHLNEQGVSYLAKKFAKLIIATNNSNHSAISLRKTFANLDVLQYEKEIDFKNLFERLKQDYAAERLTVQSGGTLNSILVREGLIDRVLLVVAPALVGGEATPTLMDGESLREPSGLSKIKTLRLVRAEPLQNSYLLLEYEVNHHA